jgi:hypothetical protein
VNQKSLENVLVPSHIDPSHSTGVVAAGEAPLDQLASLAKQKFPINPLGVGRARMPFQRASNVSSPTTLGIESFEELNLARVVNVMQRNASYHPSGRLAAAASGLVERHVVESCNCRAQFTVQAD